MSDSLFTSVDQHLSALLAPEDDALLHALQAMKDAGLPFIQVSPSQGKTLQVFARSCRSKRILEIGTLGGYSTIWLARALPEDGKLITLELDEKNADVARSNIAYAGLSSKVEVITGNALRTLERLEKENTAPFDLCFIDADKEPYTEYFQSCLRLSRPGSLIIADNVVREGEILNAESTDEKVKGVQRFARFLSECSKVTASIIPTVGEKGYDGMAVVVVN